MYSRILEALFEERKNRNDDYIGIRLCPDQLVETDRDGKWSRSVVNDLSHKIHSTHDSVNATIINMSLYI